MSSILIVLTAKSNLIVLYFSRVSLLLGDYCILVYYIGLCYGFFYGTLFLLFKVGFYFYDVWLLVVEK